MKEAPNTYREYILQLSGAAQVYFETSKQAPYLRHVMGGILWYNEHGVYVGEARTKALFTLTEDFIDSLWNTAKAQRTEKLPGRNWQGDHTDAHWKKKPKRRRTS